MALFKRFLSGGHSGPSDNALATDRTSAAKFVMSGCATLALGSTARVVAIMEAAVPAATRSITCNTEFVEVVLWGAMIAVCDATLTLQNQFINAPYRQILHDELATAIQDVQKLESDAVLYIMKRVAQGAAPSQGACEFVLSTVLFATPPVDIVIAVVPQLMRLGTWPNTWWQYEDKHRLGVAVAQTL